MPAFLLAFFGGLSNIAGHLVGRVLIALGISYVTYQGIDAGLDYIKAQALSNLSGMPAMGMTILGMLNVGASINIIFSAIAVKLVINGLTNGGITKTRIK